MAEAGSFAAVQHGTHRSAARGAAGRRAETGTGITRVVAIVPARASAVFGAVSGRSRPIARGVGPGKGPDIQ
ncbi:hypothetical protein GCM10010402_79930 [Actinomadura luteofluorescens]